MKKLLTILLLFMSFTVFGQKSIRLMWDPSTDNVGVAGYVVWIDGVRHDSTVNTYYDFDLSAGDFILTVSAYDAAGNESAQSEQFPITIADVTVPAVPDLLSVEYTEETARITWIKSNDNVAVEGYKIYVNGVFLGSTHDNSYEFKNLIPDNPYKVSISAYDAAGNESARSAEFTIEMPFDELTMKIYPNPVSKGYFKILFENGIIKDNSTISIVSMDGKIIYERQIFPGSTPHEEEFHLEETLGSGMYVVALYENKIQKLFAYIMVAKPTIYSVNFVIDYLKLEEARRKKLQFK